MRDQGRERGAGMFRLIHVGVYVVGYLLLKLGKLKTLMKTAETDPRKAEEESQIFVKQVMTGILKAAGVRVHVTGLENIPKDTAVLYVGNHRSYFDVISGYAYAPGRLGFVAKEEIRKVPVLAEWMKLLRCVFLNRSNPREGLKAILEAIGNVRNGTSMWIFPEGTRSTGSELDMLPFREGSMKIAEKTKCPVVPVAFTGTAEVFEQHFPRITAGEITLHFGEPFYIADLPDDCRKASAAYVQNRIREMICEDLGLPYQPAAEIGENGKES